MLWTASTYQGIRHRTLGKKIAIGPVSFRFFTVVLIAIAALFYLAQTTQSATKSYQLMETQSTKSKIEAENEALKVEAARLQSLNEIKKGIEGSDLEPISQ